MSVKRPVSYCAALFVIMLAQLAGGNQALGQVALSYSGADIATATGTMTITCSDALQGDLWSLDLYRRSNHFILQFTRFRDLKAGGAFNYTDGGDFTNGLWTAHLKNGSSGSGTSLVYQTVTFEELHKGSDYYSFKMLVIMTDYLHVEKWRQEVTYRINPATPAGTQWTAEIVTINSAGVDRPSSWFGRAVLVTMNLNVAPYGPNEGGYLGAYDAAGLSRHRLSDGADALWQISDNMAGANPLRQSGQPAWGQAEVLPSAAAQGLLLTAGRRFKLTTDLTNNSTSTDTFGVLLKTYAGGFEYLYFIANPYSWGLPSTVSAGASYTRHATLDINIISGPGNAPPTADAGPDQNVTDLDGDGLETVTLDAGGSSDSDGAIVSYVWRENGSEIATGQTAQAPLGIGSHSITLTVTDDGGQAASDTVVVTVIGTNLPPVADAGPNQTVVDANADGSESVTLNGAASHDSDGSIISYIWKEGPQQIASGATAQVTLAAGWHDLILVVTDNQGATGAAGLVVNIVPLDAGDFFVDQNHPQASDANPGTGLLPWKTVSKAAATATAGQTVVIKGGTYREGVVVMNSGAAGLPLTFKAASGQRVLISGADLITGWQPCSQDESRNNPNWQKIHVANIAWAPQAVFVNEIPQQTARRPEERRGMLVIQGGDSSHIVDPVNLTQPAGFWEGAQLQFYTSLNGGSRQTRTITAYDPALHQVKLDAPLSFLPVAGQDLYAIESAVALIGHPGDYAIDTTVTPNRIYLWPSTGGDPNGLQVDGVRRVWDVPLVSWAANVGHLVFDGLEAAYGVMGGFGTRDDGGHDIEIRNCIAHHCCYQGIGAGFALIDQVQNVTIRRCISYHNINSGIVVNHQNGIYGTRTRNVTIEENMVFGNNVDGLVVGWFCEDTTISRNVVYDQWSASHPDGFQTYRAIDRITLDSNLFMNTGQFSQIENTSNATFRNNMWCGAHANAFSPSPRTAEVSTPDGMIILPGCDNFNVQHDTFAFMGQGAISLCTNAVFSRNILVPGRPDSGMITGTAPWLSDFNLYWDNTGSGNAFTWPGDRGRRFPEYQVASGQDLQTAYAAPRFRNAPVLHRMGDVDKCPWYRPDLNQNTATKLWVYRLVSSDFTVGDYVEVNWDGIVRAVTEVGAGYLADAGYLVFDPPLSARPQTHDFVVANWKTVSDFRVDLRLAADSPGKALCPDGSDAGSTVDIQAYLAGDFNGDGLSELPAWPRLMPQVTATPDYNWVYQNSPVTTGNRHRCVVTLKVDDPNGNTSYMTTMEAQPGSAGQVVIEPTPDPLVWVIRGSRRGLDPTGTVNLTATVTGLSRGGEGVANFQITVRPLGDLDGVGGVTGQDKLLMNKRLNGLVPDGREFDLDGIGGASGQDKLILNKILNGLTLP